MAVVLARAGDDERRLFAFAGCVFAVFASLLAFFVANGLADLLCDTANGLLWVLCDENTFVCVLAVANGLDG